VSQQPSSARKHSASHMACMHAALATQQGLRCYAALEKGPTVDLLSLVFKSLGRVLASCAGSWSTSPSTLHSNAEVDLGM
jgi:hypothetical protein